MFLTRIIELLRSEVSWVYALGVGKNVTHIRTYMYFATGVQ